MIRVAVRVLAAKPSGFAAAATLSGAADGSVLGHYAPWTGVAQDAYDLALVGVTAGMGESEYARAVCDGAAMTYDEIVAYTLEQLDRFSEPETEADR